MVSSLTTWFLKVNSILGLKITALPSAVSKNVKRIEKCRDFALTQVSEFEERCWPVMYMMGTFINASDHVTGSPQIKLLLFGVFIKRPFWIIYTQSDCVRSGKEKPRRKTGGSENLRSCRLPAENLMFSFYKSYEQFKKASVPDLPFKVAASVPDLT